MWWYGRESTLDAGRVRVFVGSVFICIISRAPIEHSPTEEHAHLSSVPNIAVSFVLSRARPGACSGLDPSSRN